MYNRLSKLQPCSTMKLAFAITTIAALRQAAVTCADCDFGSNYTSFYKIPYNRSGYCSFEVGSGRITLSLDSNTTSSGDTNVTTIKDRRHLALWKTADKDSTVQCYPNITVDVVETAYPNGSTFVELSGDFNVGLDSEIPADDSVTISIPGFYFFKGGNFDYWVDKDGNWSMVTKAEGDISNLCEVLGDGAAPAPTPTTEAPSSGKMAVVTHVITCVAAAMLNYFMFI